jgi:hypothetical protein
MLKEKGVMRGATERIDGKKERLTSKIKLYGLTVATTLAPQLWSVSCSQ